MTLFLGNLAYGSNDFIFIISSVAKDDLVGSISAIAIVEFSNPNICRKSEGEGVFRSKGAVQIEK